MLFMEDINQNKDIETNLSTNTINEQIASLQAKVEALTKNNANAIKIMTHWILIMGLSIIQKKIPMKTRTL